MDNDKELLESWNLKTNFEEEIVAKYLIDAFIEDNQDFQPS